MLAPQQMQKRTYDLSRVKQIRTDLISSIQKVTKSTYLNQMSTKHGLVGGMVEGFMKAF